jgi:hypothetical protein
MKYTFEMGSGFVTYIRIFIKIDSGTQKLISGDIHRHTNSMDIAQVCFYIWKAGK